MATLTKLESKLGEVRGLSMAEGFEFLTMAEAGEVGHLAIVAKLNERAANAELRTLTESALPIRQRHLQEVLDGSLEHAAGVDPDEDA